MDPSLTPPKIRFGAYVADFRACELRKEGRKIRMQDKPMRLLAALTVNPGEVVSREELQRLLWPDHTFVDFETGLNAAVRKLREALSDYPENPQYVETIPKRGYRFIAEVRPLGTIASPSSVEHSALSGEVSAPTPGLRANGAPLQARTNYRTPRRIRIWMAGAVAFAFVGLILLLDLFNVVKIPLWHRDVFGTASVSPIHSIAVLPLQNLSADPFQEYLTEGMTDALITDLAHLDSVKVSSRTSTLQYKQTKKSLPQVARELGVDGIIEGTVQRSGQRIRITVQLIHGATDKHLWANSYEGDLSDIFHLERTVTEDMARGIRVKVLEDHSTAQSRTSPVDPKVLEAYLQGDYHMNQQGKGFGDEEKRKAAQFFEEAVRSDTEFALAYHGLALAHQNLMIGSSEDAAKAKQAAERAMAIDPNYSRVQVTVAATMWIPNLDLRGAQEMLEKTVSEHPAEPWAHSALCLLLETRGEREAGLQQCKIAARLDPYDDDVAQGLYFGRDYDGSIALLKMLLQSDPRVGVWHLYLFDDYLAKGLQNESIEELEQWLSLYGQPESAKKIYESNEREGFRGAIQQWVNEIEKLQAKGVAFFPGFLAQAHLILGDKDRAIYWLEQAYEHREKVSLDGGIFFIGAEPLYDPLRSDPRFKDLLRRMNLPAGSSKQ